MVLLYIYPEENVNLVMYFVPLLTYSSVPFIEPTTPRYVDPFRWTPGVVKKKHYLQSGNFRFQFP